MEPLCKKLRSTNDRIDESNVPGTLNIDAGQVPLDSNRLFDDHEKVDKSRTYEALRYEDPLALTSGNDDTFIFPPDDDITDMLQGVDYNGSLPTITERYFSTYYLTSVQKPEDDMCIRVHSNRICMVSVAPSHTIFQNGNKILKVDYKVSDKLDRTLNKVSGKSKHGAQPLQANSNICTISCSDGSTYTIKSCIIGKLLEVNEVLLHDPELLRQPPHKGGYLALVLPNLKQLDKMKDTFLTPERYEEFILLRKV